ncbi:MAG: hypothetical protein J5950_10230 [Clostridia bacterium]|nr:hypothetical protein [Clostridia bacterium]
MIAIKNHARNILILVSLVLTAAAAAVIFYPFTNERQKEIVIGASFILVALLCFISFSVNKRIYFRPGWLLQTAFFITIFALLIFFLPVIDFELNVTVYAFLAFFIASAQFCASIQLSALEIRRWWIVLIFSIVNILFGVYFLKLCSVLNISEYPSVGIYMVVLAVNFALEPWVYNKKN